MKKRKKLLKMLGVLADPRTKWVPRTPSFGQVCAVAGRPLRDVCIPSERNGAYSAFDWGEALNRAAQRHGYPHMVELNDASKSRLPVIRAYLSALVRG